MGGNDVGAAISSQVSPLRRRKQPAAKIVTLECPYCPRTVTGDPSRSIRTNFNRHLLTHTKERPYHCEFCLKRFTTSTNRRRHILRLHQELTVGWKKTPAAAQEESGVTNAVDEAQDPGDTVALECRFCGMTFSCKGTRTLHERHCPSRPHQPRRLSSSNSLMPDTSAASLAPPTDGPADAYFVCPNCEQELSGRQQLKRHMKCYCPFRDDVFASCTEDEYFRDVSGMKEGDPGFVSRTRRSRRILSRRRMGLFDCAEKRLKHEVDGQSAPEKMPPSLLRSVEALLSATQPRTRVPTTVVCPYDECISTFSSRKLWLAHVARRHPRELPHGMEVTSS